MTTHYDVLGLSRDAARDEIRAVYLHRARLLHPDAHPGSSSSMVAELNRAMAALNEAWRVLGDEGLRRRYDETLGAGVSDAAAAVVRAPSRRQAAHARTRATGLPPGFFHFGLSRYWTSSRGERVRGLYLGADTPDLSALRRFGPHELYGLEAPGVELGDGELVHLADKPGLRLLNLSRTGITDAGIVQLLRLPYLECLDLGDTAVGDEGVRVLGKMPSLRRLNLSGTSLTDAAMPDLAGLRELSILLLRRTRASGAGLRGLKGLEGLRILGLPPRLHHSDRRWLRAAFPDAALT